jgi:hypothetical protein
MREDREEKDDVWIFKRWSKEMTTKEMRIQMKKAISTMLIVALLWSCAHIPKGYYVCKRLEPVELVKGMGSTIDCETCKEYNLFENRADFKKARFYSLSRGGLEIEIEAKNDTYLSTIRDEKIVQIMRDYFGRFEEIQKNRSAFETKWGIVGYDDLGFPITLHELRKIQGGDPGCGCGAGCGILCIIPAFLAGGFLAIGGGDVTAGWGAVIVVIGVGGVLGYAIASQSLGKNAINVVKEARKPRNMSK